MKNPNNYPSLFDQGKNLAQFSWKLIQYLQQHGHEDNKNLMVSDKVYNERMEICKSCPKYDKEQIRCFECGCYLSVKARFILNECPLDKWTMSEEEWESSLNNIINDINTEE